MEKPHPQRYSHKQLDNTQKLQSGVERNAEEWHHDVRYRSGFAVCGVGAAVLKLFGTVGFAGQSFTIMTSFSSRFTAELSIVRSMPLFTSLTKGRHPIGKASG